MNSSGKLPELELGLGLGLRLGLGLGLWLGLGPELGLRVFRFVVTVRVGNHDKAMTSPPLLRLGSGAVGTVARPEEQGKFRARGVHANMLGYGNYADRRTTTLRCFWQDLNPGRF